MKIRFWFRKCQTNLKNNVGTLYGYVLLNSVRSKEFSTGISIDKKFWDSKNQKIKANPILNQELENLKNLLLKAKQRLEFDKPNFTANDVLDLVFAKKITEKKITFLQHWQNYIELKQKKENWSKSTLSGHKSMFRTFAKFSKEYNLEKALPEDINKKTIDNFFLWYNQSKNVFARFVSVIKKIIQNCIEEEYIKDHKPIFYKVERESRIDKTHLENFELEKIENYQTTNYNHSKAKDIFLFLCYLGLNFSDYLRFADNPMQYIKNGFIVIGRQKTEKKSNQKAYIPITNKIQSLLDKYAYKLPSFSFRQSVNKILKEIGQELGIEAKKMRTKVGRKTFAHNYLNTTIDRKAVSKMLGHAKTSTLEQYYADVDFDFVQDEVKKILK